MNGFKTARPLAVLALLALAGCGDRQAGANSVASADSAAAGAAADSAADSAAVAPIGPPAPLAQAPAQIRGIYLNAYSAGSRTRLPRLMAIADSTEINTFVIDVKTEKGIHYNSEIPLAKELQAPEENTLRNLKTQVDSIHARNIYTMARIVVFKDPNLSKAKTDWSIRRTDG